jgi:hypothetical protein
MEVVEITMAEKISCGYVNIEGTSNPFELQKSIFQANPIRTQAYRDQHLLNAQFPNSL